MNALRSGWRPALGAGHPYVIERRIADLAVTGLSALIPAALALAVTIALPSASLALVLAAVAGGVAIVALIVSTRLEVSVGLIALYIGLFEGPVKLFTSTREVTAAVSDALIVAICLGYLMRIAVRRQRVTLPPLSGWVLAWVVLVLVNAFNPKTEGILHALGGFRQHLQFVPFFFFGYALMRSKRRFRQLFIILGVLALANGVVAAYQTKLSPGELAGWGPGYHTLIYPSGGGTGRFYFSEGEARVRPPGLGSEAGGSGSIGHIALPMCLALVAISTRRKKWIAMLLTLGALVAVIVGLGRLQLIGAGLGVVAFAGLSMFSGRQYARTIGTLLAVVVLAIPTGLVLVSVLRPGTFKRYESINTSSSTTLHKESAWSKIPKYVEASPLGYGLGNSGAVANFGGNANTNLLEGHGLTSETEYNVLVKELGAPGLILWPLLSIYVSVLLARRIRRINDGELAICIAGTVAAFVALPIEATSGFLSGDGATGAYFWFAIGVVAYWLGGPSRESTPELAVPRRPSGPELVGGSDAAPAAA